MTIGHSIIYECPIVLTKIRIDFTKLKVNFYLFFIYKIYMKLPCSRRGVALLS